MAIRMADHASLTHRSPRSARFALALGLGLGLASCLVAPGSARAAATSAKPSKEALVTFAGFQAHADGSSQLWVDMTERRNVQVTQKGMSLVYLIEGANIRIRNNENPLRAEYFSANVLSAKLDRTKQGVTFTVTLRTATETRFRIVDQATGTASLQVEVPPPLKPVPPSAG